MKLPFKFRKKQFLSTFCAIVILLALVHCFFPAVGNIKQVKIAERVVNEESTALDSIDFRRNANDSLLLRPRVALVFVNNKGERIKHKIYSVSNFKNSFPDLNDLQLVTAERLGVTPAKNRKDAEIRKKELVYVGSSPYFYVEKLKHSIPYLVPRASNLLSHIGRTFLDSLEIKNIPLNTLIVTSVMRTDEDV
ncbi:MAG: DUF5715 family protein, partial [Bacteroidaceae bacterium]